MAAQEDPNCVNVLHLEADALLPRFGRLRFDFAQATGRVEPDEKISVRACPRRD
jgi:hypothetical protein